MPAISVLLPVFNGGDLLRLSVESVLGQSLANFELVVCDDGSRDTSVTYLAGVRDPRVRFLRNPSNRGLFPTLNRLLEESRSPLLHLWSQDDIMRPCCLERVVEFHRQNPALSMSFSQFELIDGSGAPLKRQMPEDDPAPRFIDPELYLEMSLMWGCLPYNIANVTLARWAVERHGKFQSDFIYAGDFEFWTRLARHGPIARQEERLIQLREHPGQFSARMPDRVTSIAEVMPIFRDLLERSDPGKRGDMERIWRWRVLPSQLRTAVACLLRRRWDLCWRVCQTLRRFDSLGATGARLLVLEMLRLARLHDHFIHRLYLAGHLQRLHTARQAETLALAVG